ncbi:MAG: YfhO family protein [Agathobacter sp.]|nr:YfhO family protein [Agathobacter sp.]
MDKKIYALLRKKWIWSVLAFGIPFVVSVTICAVAGTYPFGENCILHMDMYHQYCPFFMEFQEKLTQGGSLLYSWNLGLGSDFIAHYAYYLASPLNWLLVLCPQGLVIEFMTLTIWIKIALAGLFFFWYLKEHFTLIGKDGRYHTNTVVPALVFSTAYAFSGYVAAYSWNIMWMDSIALAPLVILGLELLVKKNKPALYYVSLAVSILCNFYISLIICIFLVLYFVILFLEQKEGKIKASIRFAWYSLLAGGTGAILLIPEAIILGYAKSADTTLPEKVEWYFGFIEELSRLCTAATPYKGTNHWPNLYCGAFTVLLVLMYVFNRRIKWTQKIPRIVLLGFFLVSFANNYLDFLWHGLRFPNSLPARQSFLFIFLMLVMGYECYRKQRGNRIWHMLVALALCLTILIVGALQTDENVTEPMAFVLTGIFIVSYGLCFLVHKIGTKQICMMAKGFAFGLALGEILLNMAITGFYSLNRTAYLAKMDDYELLIEIAEEDAKEKALGGEMPFYRIEDYERRSKNDNAFYGYPSGTIFSTLLNSNVSNFYRSTCMEGGLNYYCYNGATPLISSMLSVRYMLSDHDAGENALRKLVASSGQYYLYENNYCLPLGFMMKEEDIEAWTFDKERRLAQINHLGYILGAKEDTLTTANVSMDVQEGCTSITVEEGGIYYAQYNTCSADNLSIRINNGPITRYNKTTHRYLFELGQCEPQDVIKITNSKSEEISFIVYKLNEEAVDTAYETLSQQTMVTEEYTDTYIKGSIEVEDPGRLILSIPREDGWTLYVDGKETEMISFQEAFISVHLDEGTHEIKLKYMTPGLKEGACISAGCVLLFAITMIVRRRFAKKSIAKQ